MSFAPSARASRAVSRPMPALPPITTTVCPASGESRRKGEGVLAVLMDSSIFSFGRRHSGRFCRCGKCRRILSNELLHTERTLHRQCAHVVRHYVEAPSTVKIGHRREVVHEVTRRASLEQTIPTRLNRNIMIGDRSAQRL